MVSPSKSRRQGRRTLLQRKGQLYHPILDELRQVHSIDRSACEIIICFFARCRTRPLVTLGAFSFASRSISSPSLCIATLSFICTFSDLAITIFFTSIIVVYLVA